MNNYFKKGIRLLPKFCCAMPAFLATCCQALSPYFFLTDSAIPSRINPYIVYFFISLINTTVSLCDRCMILQRNKNIKLLPTAYVVRGKIMFWHVSVHPSVCPHLVGGGYPSQVQAGGGYLDGGNPTPGTPLSDFGGGTPPRVPPSPHRTWPGGTPTGGWLPHLGSTWYAAVGMPLAFTREDFLVT